MMVMPRTTNSNGSVEYSVDFDFMFGRYQLFAPVWRDHLPVHPAAAAMRPCTSAEFDILCHDIETNGLRVPPVLYRDAAGTLLVLDGCNRLDALEATGCDVIDDNGQLRVPVTTIEYDADFDPVAYVRSVNIARRHFTRDELRQYVDDQLTEHPEKTDRQIAREAGVSHHTVASARRANGQIAHKDRQEASGRKARGRKPGAAPTPKPPLPTPNGEPRPRDYAERQTAVMEALTVLAAATAKTLQTTPSDPVDIAARWTDGPALGVISAWIGELREAWLIRQRTGVRQ
jgi:hypothetical protein